MFHATRTRQESGNFGESSQIRSALGVNPIAVVIPGCDQPHRQHEVGAAAETAVGAAAAVTYVRAGAADTQVAAGCTNFKETGTQAHPPPQVGMLKVSWAGAWVATWDSVAPAHMLWDGTRHWVWAGAAHMDVVWDGTRHVAWGAASVEPPHTTHRGEAAGAESAITHLVADCGAAAIEMPFVAVFKPSGITVGSLHCWAILVG